jgi:mxaA protein
MSPFARPLFLVITAVILSMTHAARAAPAPVTVEQPRAFGYTVGDLLSQRILLPLGNDGSSATIRALKRMGKGGDGWSSTIRS